ncbi:MAG: endonuclease V [Atribacterota bacterium]|nr:endonuclease V [Atribacterota bacterium]
MMKKCHDFPYELSLKEALCLQEEMKSLVEFDFPYREEDVHFVAGVDVSYDQEGFSFGTVVVLEFPSLKVVEVVCERHRPSFPYIPGFLSFREGPVIEKAFSKLSVIPQIFFFDGQGIAHPRGVGLATHLGVAFGVTSLGIAKKPLLGTFSPPGEARGDFSTLEYQGKTVGIVLRTRERVKPVFVSPGNKIGLSQLREWTLRVTGKYRLPEPTRLAHIFSEKGKRGEL